MGKDNKGYSLVELIIVIAIMALLSGTAFFSISMIFGASAKACANDIKEALAESKVTAMGKSEAKIQIYRDVADNCVYVKQWVKKGKNWEEKKDGSGNPVLEKVGNSRVYISYKAKDEALVELLPGEENSLWLCYDRSNGSFSNKSGCTICEEIYVKGGSRSYKLTLTELTGKVALELEHKP